jgi:hypothetical protein
VPAALQAPFSDPGQLLHRLASVVFDAEGMRGFWRERIDEGALIRNLSFVLHSRNFEILQAHISGLLDRGYGRSLLSALNSPEYGAMILRDENGAEDFVAMAGPALAELGLSDTPTPLRLRKNSKYLSDLLSKRSWELPVSRPLTLTGRLGQRGAPVPLRYLTSMGSA